MRGFNSYSALAAVALVTVAVTGADAKTMRGDCVVSGPHNTCLRCDFNAAGTYRIGENFSFYCPRLPKNAQTVATIVGTSTVFNAPPTAGTWVNWLFSFGESSQEITAAGPHSIPFQGQSTIQVIKGNLGVATLKPTFSQWGNAEGKGSPGVLLSPSGVSILVVGTR